MTADCGLLLDLSAAFSTISHTILFNRLSYSLEWFYFYLSGRIQSVQFKSFHSWPSPVVSGVLRVLSQAPCSSSYIFFLLAIFSGSLTFIFIATWITPISTFLSSLTLSFIPHHVSKIKSWFTTNFQELNIDQTENLLVGTKSILSKMHHFSHSMDGSIFLLVGVIFDSSLSFTIQINNITR